MEHILLEVKGFYNNLYKAKLSYTKLLYHINSYSKLLGTYALNRSNLFILSDCHNVTVSNYFTVCSFGGPQLLKTCIKKLF